MTRSDKPHARLAHESWRDQSVRDGFRREWSNYLEANRGGQVRVKNWDTMLNMQNWAFITNWRLFDAFGIRQVHFVPQDIRHAFEAILLADVKGEALTLAYDYAEKVIDSGLVPQLTRAYALLS